MPGQVDAWGFTEHSIDTIRDFLRFMDIADRLQPAGIRVPALLKELAAEHLLVGDHSVKE